MTGDAVQVSVVLPCLNEEATLAACIQAAWNALERAGIRGEIVVADNGSTDRSRAIAEKEGARVVAVPRRGYGSALRVGIEAAKAPLLVFLDADMSYDFAEIPRFVEALRDGADIVIGSRMRGSIDKGAMPVSHRLVGTPALTLLANLLFRCGITDINCGMRGLTRAAYARLHLFSEGMEFASEMMIKAALNKMRVTELPIAFHPDRRGRPPHLRSFQDGWRHLHLMLHYCPIWLYLVPGLLLSLGGFAAMACWPFALGPASAFVAAVLALCAAVAGIQILFFGLTTQDRIEEPRYRNYAFARRLSPWFSLANGMLLGALTALCGSGLLGYAACIAARAHADVGAISWDVGQVRLALIGGGLLLCGLQVFYMSLFLGLFGIRVTKEGQ